MVIILLIFVKIAIKDVQAVMVLLGANAHPANLDGI